MDMHTLQDNVSSIIAACCEFAAPNTVVIFSTYTYMSTFRLATISNPDSQILIPVIGSLSKSPDSISKFSMYEGQTNRYLHYYTKRFDQNWRKPRCR